MFDPENPDDIQRLMKSVRSSYHKLERYREKRRKLVEDYVGDLCVDGTNTGKEMPVNLLSLMVDVYLMHLAGNSPQVLLPTFDKSILPFVADLEAIVNQELREMRFDKTVRRCVLEAIFCMCILKCGLVDGEYIELIPGQPQPTQDYFCDIIDFDDFVYDVEASAWDKITFIGDKYRVDYEAVMSDSAYPIEARRSLVVREDGAALIAETDTERTSSVGIDPSAIDSQNTFKRSAWVWDIALPEEGLVLTVPLNSDSRKALKIVEWDGVSTTPYKTLWFNDVPGNTMPLAPGQVVKSLNRSMNALFRKMVRQAERQKTVSLYRIGQDDDARRIQAAQDGDLVGVSDPQAVVEASWGGAAPENQALAITINELFSRLSGNLDAMGGLGPQSQTVGQDQMIAAQVSQKTAKMQRTVVDFTVEVVRDMLHRIWHDPLGSYSATRTIAGTNFEVEALLQPGEREGTFDSFSIMIEPYSMQYRSPNERAGDILQLLTQIVIPVMPLLMQQGIGVNWQRVFEVLSKYRSLPEVNQFLEFIGVPMPGVSGQEPTQPQVSHRTYERINRPGATRQGNDRTMQQLLMGGNPQQSQVAALSRPAGV